MKNFKTVSGGHYTKYGALLGMGSFGVGTPFNCMLLILMKRALNPTLPNLHDRKWDSFVGPGNLRLIGNNCSHCAMTQSLQTNNIVDFWH